MWELSWCLWYVLFNSYFLMFAEMNERWKIIYYKYLDRYFLPDLAFDSSVVSGIIFRIYCCYLVYDEYNQIFIPIILCNIMVIFFDCNIIYNMLFKKNDILLRLSLYPVNVIEFVMSIGIMNVYDKLYSIHKVYLCLISSIFLAYFFIALFFKLSVRFIPMQNIQNNYRKKPTDVKYEIKIVQNEMFENKACPICLDDFEINSQYYLLECEHYGHPDCLDGWWDQCGQKKCFYNFCQKSNQ